MESSCDNDLLKNSSLQADEIEALAAIYEENFTLEDKNAIRIKISKCEREVLLNVTLPEGYPSKCPPIYEISAPWMSRESKLLLNDEIQDVYCNNIGECIIHLWVVTIMDFIENITNNEEKENEISEASNDTGAKDLEPLNLPNIEHGEPIIDRKSVFQAHLARITTEKEVSLILRKLKENKKIATATHNSYAYRISLPDNTILEGIEDDGEKKAGTVLLRILQFANLSNILIIVSRWYGGVHLGADRFKDYSNAARNLINSLELIQNPKNEDFKEKQRR